MLAGSTTAVVDDRPRAGSNTSGTSDDSNHSTSTSPSSDATGAISNSNKQLARIERRPGQQRRYAPKTRTGCITCKYVQRRLFTHMRLVSTAPTFPAYQTNLHLHTSAMLSAGISLNTSSYLMIHWTDHNLLGLEFGG